MNLTASILRTIEATPSSAPRSEYDVIQAWNSNSVLVMLQFVTGEESCTAGGRAYPVGEGSSVG